MKDMMNKTAISIVAALCGLASTNSFGDMVTIDISGYSSWDFQGDPQNEIANIMLGPSASITHISWNINLTTVGVSWAEESTIGLMGNIEQITPGFGDGFPVSNMNYQGSQASSIVLGADAMLDIEFYEFGFDDNADAIDSYFEAGSTITFHGRTLYPTPSTIALFGFTGLCVSRRRR